MLLSQQAECQVDPLLVKKNYEVNSDVCLNIRILVEQQFDTADG